MNLEELYRLLRSSHVQSQGIVDTLEEPLVVLDKDFCVTNANPGFFRTFQADRHEVMGKNLFELGNGQWDIKELRKLLSDVVPKTRAIVGYEVVHEFLGIGLRTMLVTARRLQHPDSNSTQMLVVFEDITERKDADAAKDLLLAETRHRMKNLMAILRGVASQTRVEDQSAEQYRDVFIGRMEAVLKAQALISEPGSEAPLFEIVEETVRPVAGARAEIVGGPPVVLSEHQILPVSMMLHELTTNALKYGALSEPSGLVKTGWATEDRDGADFVLLDWREQGGPTVTPPARQGFGLKMIQHSLRAEGGDVKFDFATSGLHAHIAFPLKQ